MGGSGPGNVNGKIRDLTEKWGTLPEHKRAAAIQELTKDLPPRYRAQIEDYFKTINKNTSNDR